MAPINGIIFIQASLLRMTPDRSTQLPLWLLFLSLASVEALQLGKVNLYAYACQGGKQIFIVKRVNFFIVQGVSLKLLPKLAQLASSIPASQVLFSLCEHKLLRHQHKLLWHQHKLLR